MNDFKNRKIIFETVAGSKLYGTNHEKSDDDFLGIFIPSINDLFTLQNCPKEWDCGKKKSEGQKNSLGDIDRKYFSLKQFLSLAAEGQSKQLEMLFSPKEKWTVSSPEWEFILSHRDLFISQNSISPFLGFATAQAHKAFIKGENLRLISRIISFFKDKKGKAENYKDDPEFKELKLKIIDLENENNSVVNFYINIGLDKKPVWAFEVAGRKYQLSLKTNDLVSALESVLNSYGSRSKQASLDGYDFKSLAHAYRLLFECESILTNHKLILPLPDDQVKFLKSIIRGEYSPDTDFFTELDLKIKEIKKIKSTLPKNVDHKKIENLCQTMFLKYFNIKD